MIVQGNRDVFEWVVMLDGATLGWFLMASFGVTIAPGPDNLFVLANGISHSSRSAMYAAWGMASGVFVHTTLAACGVSALIYASPWAFTILKFAGAGYLFYLAYGAFRERNQSLNVSDVGSATVGNRSFWKLYGRGFFMNVVNPKVGIFFLAFLPQFIALDSSHAGLQLLLLGCIFMIQAAVVFTLIAWFASAIGQWIRQYPMLNKGLSLTTCMIFLLLGLKLVLEKAVL